MTMVLDGSGISTTGVPNLGTAQASTSGTAITFTGIPAGVRRITVMFQGVSTSGANDVLIQVGSGSLTTTGYLGASASIAASGAASNFTTGIGIRAGGSSGAAATRHGAIVITLISGNNWVAQGCIGYSDAATAIYTGSSIALSGTLDRVSVTTLGGTDTFDAGSINILYE